MGGLTRRRFVVRAAGAAAAASLPLPAIAEAKPVKIGLLTIKTGPLAPAGIQLEQGTLLFLKDQNHKLAGRQAELVVADTGGNPAGAKTKAQELIERDGVDLLFGPLAAFELLAISDYVASKKMPILGLAAAEDMTQRRPNPYFLRASATSAQFMHPLADYAAKELKYKTMITMSDDFAFGYEQMGGFQRVFEDSGGRIVKKLWSPLSTPDYAPYLTQIGGADAVVIGFAGANPPKFLKQYKTAGLKLPVLGGEGTGDDSLLKTYGEEAVGIVTAAPYSADFDSPSNKKFVAGMLKEYGNLPGVASSTPYISGMVVAAALEKTAGATDDKEKLTTALRAVALADSPRGAFHFDHFGNIVGNIFIRRCDRKGGKLVNTTVKTYPNVSQFWTYDENWFLAQPVYSRNYPPLKS